MHTHHAGAEGIAVSSNKEILELIKSEYESGRLCFFLGSGASVEAGLPIASGFIKIVVQGLLSASSHPGLSTLLQKTKSLDRILDRPIIEALRLEVLLGAIDSHQISGRPPSGRPPNFYAANIARTIAAQGKPSSFHKFLATGLNSRQIPSVLTTNWDCLVEEGFSVTDPVYIAWNAASFATAPRTRLLAKLHGTVSSKNDDLTTQDEKRMSLVTDPLGIGGALPEEIYDVIARYFQSKDFSICIVGYSGRDPDIRIAFQQATSRVFWAIHWSTDVGKMKAHVRELMPKAEVHFIDTDELKSTFHCLEAAFVSEPSQLSILGELSIGARLTALGTALHHAACGELPLNCFETAVRVEPRNVFARYNLARENVTLYKSWRSIGMFLRLLPNLWKSPDPVLKYEIGFYALLALENISVFGWRLTPFGQNLCGVIFAFLRFDKMEQLEAKLKTGAGSSWLRSADGETWYRFIAMYINYSQSSARVQWYSRHGIIEGRLLKALNYAEEAISPSLRGHVLRYLGRWYGLQGEYAKSDESYTDAQYWLEAISDHNGVTEVKKYKFKTQLGRSLDYRTDKSLHSLCQELATEYPAQRGILPAYIRNFRLWQEGRGWKRKYAEIMILWWRWVMRRRWGF
jgi:hypothetical protein